MPFPGKCDGIGFSYPPGSAQDLVGIGEGQMDSHLPFILVIILFTSVLPSLFGGQTHHHSKSKRWR